MINLNPNTVVQATKYKKVHRHIVLCSMALLSTYSVLASAALPPLETRPPNATDLKPVYKEQTRAPALKTKQAINVETITTGIDKGWSFEFLPDGNILVAEKPGQFKIVYKDGSKSAAIPVPNVLEYGQGGLLDVALDPAFASNGIIYWTHAETVEGDKNTTVLVKGKLSYTGATPTIDNIQVIFRQQPALASRLHFGSRIVFNPDGTLFLGLGERSIPEGRVQAQDLNSHLGKVVRLNTDGSVPADNPYVGKDNVRPEIWSYGHRNIQAADLDEQGRLWVIEHGPRGGDELNLVKPTLNYGWPVITYGIEYSGSTIGDGISQYSDMQQPVYYWDPVIAPSGMIFYTADLIPEWKGSIFVGGLGGLKLVRLELKDDKVIGEEWFLTDQLKRFRDVRQGPDGAVYVLTDGPDGVIFRLAPAE